MAYLHSFNVDTSSLSYGTYSSTTSMWDGSVGDTSSYGTVSCGAYDGASSQLAVYSASSVTNWVDAIVLYVNRTYTAGRGGGSVILAYSWDSVSWNILDEKVSTSSADLTKSSPTQEYWSIPLPAAGTDLANLKIYFYVENGWYLIGKTSSYTASAQQIYDVSVYYGVSAPVISVGSITPASSSTIISTTRSFSVTVSGGTTNAATWSASAGSFGTNTNSSGVNTVTWTAPSSVGTYTITATSSEDGTKSSSTTAYAVAAASVTSFSASTTNPLNGATNVTITPTYAGASAIIGTSYDANDISASASSGIAIGVQTGGFTTTTTYYLKVTGATGDVARSSITITPQTVTITSISPSSFTQLENTAQAYTATVTGATNTSVSWTAKGTIIATNRFGTDYALYTDVGSWNDNVWTAPSADIFWSASTVTITATAYAGGSPLSTTTTVAAGLSANLVASPTTIDYGAYSTLTPYFNGDSASIDNGVGTVYNATGVNVFPTATTTYTLTTTRTTPVGTATGTATVTVRSIGVSVSPSSSSVTNLSGFNTSQFTATVTNATNTDVTWYVDNILGGNSSVGTISTSGLYTAGSSTGTHTIKAIASADGSTPGTATVTVYATPTAVLSVPGNNTSIPYNGSVTITATFSNGTATVDQGIGTLSSTGTTFSSGTITINKTFTLTVTNSVGAYVTSSITLYPQTVSVSDISPADSFQTELTAKSFSATASGGATNTIDWSAKGYPNNDPYTSWSGSTWTAPSLSELNFNSDSYVIIYARSHDLSSVYKTTKVTIVAAVVTPSITASSYVLSNSTGNTASIQSQSGCTYFWSLSSGTITSGQNTTSITWTAPSSGNITISCTVTNQAGSYSTGTKSSSVASNASIASFSASTTNPAYGATNVTITPTYVGASAIIGTSYDANDISSSASSGVAIGVQTGGFTTTTTYYLKVTGAAGDVVRSSITITPQTVTVSNITPTNLYQTTNTSRTFNSIASGGTTNTITWSARGNSSNLLYPEWDGSTWTAPALSTLFANNDDSIIIYAKAHDLLSIYKTLSVTIVAAAITPTISVSANTIVVSSTGNTASISSQPGCTYFWSITNGTITAGQNTTSITWTASSTASTALISCTVTNLAGDSASAGQASVSIIVLPSVTSLTASPSIITVGNTSTISWTTSNATYISSSPSLGTTATSGSVYVSPSSTTSYSITPINSGISGTSSSTTVTVVAAPSISNFSASPSSITSGSSSTLSATFSNGTGVITPGNISITSDGTNPGTVIVSPTITTTYTLTVTNSANTSVTSSSTITVIGAPTSGITTCNKTYGYFGQSVIITPTSLGTNGQNDIVNTVNISGTDYVVSVIKSNITDFTPVSTMLIGTSKYKMRTTNSLGEVIYSVGNSVNVYGKTYSPVTLSSPSYIYKHTNVGNVSLSQTGNSFTMMASSSGTSYPASSIGIRINSFGTPITTRFSYAKLTFTLSLTAGTTNPSLHPVLDNTITVAASVINSGGIFNPFASYSNDFNLIGVHSYTPYNNQPFEIYFTAADFVNLFAIDLDLSCSTDAIENYGGASANLTLSNLTLTYYGISLPPNGLKTIGI